MVEKKNQQSDSDDEKSSKIDPIYSKFRFYRNAMPQAGDITRVVTTQVMELGDLAMVGT